MTMGISKQYGALINGQFQTIQGETFPVLNASTGEHLADMQRSDATLVNQAVQAAKAAYKSWSKTLPEERSALLLQLADRLEADLDRLAAIDAMDIGRRVLETQLDHRIAISQYRYFAAAILTHEGFGRPIPNGYMMAKREPLGVCGQIIPWNVPAIMTALKLAPALAAGNTVVLKPDEHACLGVMEAVKHMADIFPAGVINVVPGMGDEAGAALTAHPDIAKLAFTGSTEVGRIIAHAAAEKLLPVTLELGGKSPNIVFPDIEDMDAVVDNAVFAFLYCNGQACLAGTRLFVHASIYDEFVKKLTVAAAQVKIGDPLDESVRLSCLVSPKQGERVLSYIQMAKEEGATLLYGGQRVAIEGHEVGYFIEPTIFEATNDMRIAQEEVFGPVLTVIKWHDYEQMIEEANDVRYGLAAGIYTSNLKNAMETADRLQAGSIWINEYFNLAAGSPFGGYKESGLGKEFSHETLKSYTQLKAITVQNTVNPAWYTK